MVLLSDLPAKRGQPALGWYDELVSLMAQVAELLGIKVSTAGDRAEDPYATPLLLTSQEAAAELKVSESFLAKARMRGTGPAFIQLGRAVRYSRSALETYKALQTRISTSHQQMLNRSAPRTYRQGSLNS